MNATLESVEEAAMQLSTRERLLLARDLIKSVDVDDLGAPEGVLSVREDGEPSDEMKAEWERRSSEAREGRAKLYSVDEVMDRLRPAG